MIVQITCVQLLCNILQIEWALEQPTSSLFNSCHFLRDLLLVYHVHQKST
jgi:hypothetical protein